MPTNSLFLLLVVVCTCALIAGCASTPARPAQTPPPRSGPQGAPLMIDQMGELIDEMVQRLAVRLPNIPEVRDSEYQSVLTVSDVNVSGFSDPRRFEESLQSIVGRLMSNGAVTDSFVVVETNLGSADAYIRSISGRQLADFDDPAQRSPDASAKARYDPRTIYFLTGRFFQAEENGDRAYRLHIDVEHPMSKRRVFTESFERRFRWDGVGAKWVPAR